MDGMEIFKQDVCRAALECNANLVVAEWEESILVL